MSTVVFLGPTFSRTRGGGLPMRRYLPPARQGDVFIARCAAIAPRAIGMIDGVFLDVPAVWHREILWALVAGRARVRRGEHGRAARRRTWRRSACAASAHVPAYATGVWPGFDEPFEDDDEVAVLHAPPEAGGGALSDAMVDLRETLLAAEAAGVIDRAGAMPWCRR